MVQTLKESGKYGESKSGHVAKISNISILNTEKLERNAEDDRRE